MAYLKELIEKHIRVELTDSHVQEIIRWCSAFELRGEHPLAFNSPLLGCHRAYFHPIDADTLFHIVNVSKREFIDVIGQSAMVKKNRKVSSDPFSLLAMWLIHLTYVSRSLPEAKREECRMALGKMMHYRFFTSVVNHNLPHGANEEVMKATIDGLTAKFDIKDPATPTWRLVIEARCRDLFSKESIHYGTFIKFAPDEGTPSVSYAINEPQGRLRTKLVLISQLYYDNHAKNIRIGTSTLVDTIDGEKEIRDIADTYDDRAIEVCNRAINTNRFIQMEHIKLIANLSTNVRQDTFRLLLTKFSEQASFQYHKHLQDQVEGTGEAKRLIGYQILIRNIIQKTYRYCVLAGQVDMKSKVQILIKTRDIYRSSRIADPDILCIKESVSDFVEKNSGSTREGTNASLKIAFLCYIMLLSFD